MDNAEWQEFVEDLVEAKACLGEAWRLLDGIEGAAPGVEEALHSALSAIDTVYAIERENPAHMDVASPDAVDRFWTVHRALPGFAVGS